MPRMKLSDLPLEEEDFDVGGGEGVSGEYLKIHGWASKHQLEVFYRKSDGSEVVVPAVSQQDYARNPAFTRRKPKVAEMPSIECGVCHMQVRLPVQLDNNGINIPLPEGEFLKEALEQELVAHLRGWHPAQRMYYAHGLSEAARDMLKQPMPA